MIVIISQSHGEQGKIGPLIFGTWTWVVQMSKISGGEVRMGFVLLCPN
jgi:hypothetical protein